MKRSVLIMLTSVLILLTACRSKPQTLRDTYEADVVLTSGTLDCTAHLSRNPDAVTITFLSPATVAGVSYTYSGGELTTSYSELSSITDSDSLPPSSAPALLCKALSGLDSAAFDAADDGVDLYRVQLDTGVATVACRDGLPVRITADSSPYVIALTAGSPE